MTTPLAGTVPATGLRLNAGGTGHMLYAPYFTTQAKNSTLLNITNTDMTNGKAVKVRFRGAANSDDVLDFTVFLSPGDVWTASLVQDANGFSNITTTDTSCTLPTSFGNGVAFKTNRVASYLAADAQAAHTREGYVEVLNMADIEPNETTGSLYHSTKHVNGVPRNCNAAILTSTMLNTTVLADAAAAAGVGLYAPTGGLMGSWAVMNQEKLAVYGGAMTAVQAVGAGDANGAAAIVFAPQVGSPIGAALDTTATATNGTTGGINGATADPLLHGGYVTPLWFDLPDMSTPLVPAQFAQPQTQVLDLAGALARTSVINEYVNAAGGAVPMETDWVVSQPTRRYYAAVDYASSATAAQIIWNDDMTVTTANALNDVTTAPAATANPYAILVKESNGFGPFACLTAGLSTADREENFTSAAADFSPGTTSNYCGEVFTLSFGGNSVLNASLSNTAAEAQGAAGWGQLTLANSAELPIVGFAATSMQGATGNYGLTLPYRWN
ncbi:MAG: cell surface protein [Pseudomonadota bacterium]|nr:cell surface protein [Pseudomonadota bacterium]